MMIKNIKKSCNKKDVRFWILLLMISFGLFVTYYNGAVHPINSTMFAFTYKYGFISRGFIGTVFRVWNHIIPWETVNYLGVMQFTQIMTIIYFVILYVFYYICLKFTEERYKRHLQYIITFFTIFAIPMFSARYNFGRLDLYMVMLSLLGAILLIIGKMEFLLVPICAMGVMVHQGYVFMFFNIILVLLLYKILTNEQNKKKYMILFAVCFVTASVLFLWFELFSHANGENIYDEIINVAKMVSEDGETIHQDVIDKEILGVDLSDREVQFRLQNLVQFPIFVVLTLPYLVIAFRFFRRLIQAQTEKKNKWKYIFVAIGSGTILPDMLLKCDYGRWVFAIICYYAVVIMALMAMGDSQVKKQIGITMHKIKEKSILEYALVAYPIMFQPLQDVTICEFVAKYAGLINDNWLHWW
jgi:hypothetical protein